LENIEELLKKHYANYKRIDYLKRKYDRLSNNMKELEQCISNTNHTLEVLLPSQRYDTEKVSTSKTHSSPQERALLQSEQRMEQKIRDFQQDQEDCLLERYELERECEEIDALIQGLEDDEQMICELKYKHKKSMTYISLEVCADRTTVRRRLIKIHEKFAEELGLIA